MIDKNRRYFDSFDGIMNTSVRSKFLRSLEKRSIPHYPKRVSSDKLREALGRLEIWGHNLIVKTINNEVYRIVDFDTYILIDINGNRVWARDIVDYFVYPSYQVY